MGHDQRAVCVRPRDWFAYCERITGRPRPTLPALAVQTVIRSHFDYVVEAFGAQADDFTLADHPFAIFRYRDHEIAIGWSAKGSYAAGGLDEMIALGATTIILLGGAATLVHDIAVDDLLIVTKALRDDGISLHYQPPTRYSHPSSRLTAFSSRQRETPGTRAQRAGLDDDCALQAGVAAVACVPRGGLPGGQQ